MVSVNKPSPLSSRHSPVMTLLLVPFPSVSWAGSFSVFADSGFLHSTFSILSLKHSATVPYVLLSAGTRILISLSKKFYEYIYNNTKPHYFTYQRLFFLKNSFAEGISRVLNHDTDRTEQPADKLAVMSKLQEGGIHEHVPHFGF